MKDIILKDMRMSKELERLGFKRESHLDFRDDGSSFRMYSYKGIPISVLKDRYGKETLYLCIRDDYCGSQKKDSKNSDRATRNTPFDWWFDYGQKKKVVVVNSLTGETFEDNLMKIEEKYNGEGSTFSVGFVMGICETYLKEFPIAEEEYKKDIQQKREKFEEKIKKIIKQGSNELGWFLEETKGAFLHLSKYLFPYQRENFTVYWDSLEETKKKWDKQAKELTDAEIYQWCRGLERTNWKLNIEENFYVNQIREMIRGN